MMVLEYYDGENVLFSSLWRSYWSIEMWLTDGECEEVEGALGLVDALWACRETFQAVAMHRMVELRIEELSRHPGQHPQIARPA